MDQLPHEVRRELASLTTYNAEIVARRLVMAARTLEDDPETAYAHAMAALRSASRVGVVREAAGLAAYASGHYAEALAQLRAARRITGSDAYLPVMADCERGLGRPEKALEVIGSVDLGRLDHAGRVELRIVSAGARRDRGQYDAAVVTLQGPDLTPAKCMPWTARLRYAYADALLAAGRRTDALEWFRRAAEADVEGVTDAADRLADLEGLVFVDLEELEATELENTELENTELENTELENTELENTEAGDGLPEADAESRVAQGSAEASNGTGRPPALG